MPNPTSTSTDRGAAVIPAVALALPVLALVAAALAMLLGEAAGLAPVWFEPEMTLSEAAALRDGGLVVRMIREGTDPNRPAAVRDGILRSRDYVMTPLEAAIGARRVEIVALLERNGARIDDNTRPVLVCFARKVAANDIVEYLTRGRPPIDCQGVRDVDF